MIDVHEFDFFSAGVRCAATHFAAASNGFAGSAGRPCVVMAHGFGGTRDTGLADYAEGFASAGIDVVLFDYRGFGRSDGSPRQRVSYRAQRADYHSAVNAARGLQGVDPDRIILWGTSYSGGHVVAVAAQDPRIAATISLTPLLDGSAALAALATQNPALALRLLAHGVFDVAGAALGRRRHMLPIVGPAGATVLLPSPGAHDGYRAIAGPTWRNEVTARSALEVAFNRPLHFAGRRKVPMLVQIGELDSVAPPSAARRAVARAGALAELRAYPVDHFDVYGGYWQDRALADQLAFLTQSLAVPSHRRAGD